MQLSDVVRIALIFSEDAKCYAKKLAGSIDLSGKADLQDGKTKTAQMAKSFTFDKTTVKFNY